MGEDQKRGNEMVVVDGQVPDLPCPKCGHADVRIRYCDGCKLRMWNDPCLHREPEHFHRSCRRCGYFWQTNDAIDPKVMCKSVSGQGRAD